MLIVDLVSVALIALASVYLGVRCYRVYALFLAAFIVLDHSLLFRLGEPLWQVSVAFIFLVYTVITMLKVRHESLFKITLLLFVILLIVKPITFSLMGHAVEGYNKGVFSYEQMELIYDNAEIAYDLRDQYFPHAWLTVIAMQLVIMTKGGRNGRAISRSRRVSDNHSGFSRFFRISATSFKRVKRI